MSVYTIYTFDGWSDGTNTYRPEELPPVTGNVTYTAKYTETARKYTVTWKDDNGAVLGSEEYTYDSTPAYPNGAPSKAGQEGVYEYRFSGWKDADGTLYTDVLPPVTEDDVTYTAQYTKYYAVVWKNGDEVQTDWVEDGKTPEKFPDEPTKEDTPEFTYTFDGWSDGEGKLYETVEELPAVTGKVTYTATFTATKRTYTVTWVFGNGATDETESVEYNDKPTKYPDDPEKASTAEFKYTFLGWKSNVEGDETLYTSKEMLKKVTGDVTYTAQYKAEKRSYTITWVDEDGDELTHEEVYYGERPVYDGTTPTKDQDDDWIYDFDGWQLVLEDGTVEGTIYSNQSLPEVTGAAVYRVHFARTARNYYTVTWYDEDGETVLGTSENIPKYSSPTWSNIQPAKPETIEHVYVFEGWVSADGKM